MKCIIDTKLIEALDQVVTEVSSMTYEEFAIELEKYNDSEFVQTVQTLFNIANPKPLDEDFAQILNDNIIDLLAT